MFFLRRAIHNIERAWRLLVPSKTSRLPCNLDEASLIAWLYACEVQLLSKGGVFSCLCHLIALFFLFAQNEYCMMVCAVYSLCITYGDWSKLNLILCLMVACLIFWSQAWLIAIFASSSLLMSILFKLERFLCLSFSKMSLWSSTWQPN